MSDIRVFKRYEKKYMMTKAQYEKLVEALGEHLVKDEYFYGIVSNIYYDTPDYRLIRDSIEKPFYKEKLRLRSYGKLKPDDKAYLEIKKKYDGVVYKRRDRMIYRDAVQMVEHPEEYIKRYNEEIGSDKPESERMSQISKELTYFINYYKELKPAVYLGYERHAYKLCPEDDVRITFDFNARWRHEEANLTTGHYGNLLMDEDKVLMELKTPMAIPLYLVRLLEEMKIYPTSFSKYGTAYKTIIGKVDSDTSSEHDEYE